MFDGGLVKIYKIGNVNTPGDTPVEALTFYQSFYFEEKTIGMTRAYAAMQADSKIDRLISIWQDRTVTAECVCVIFDGSMIEDNVEVGIQYRITQAQHKTNNDGLRISDLTLERLDGGLYDIE
ncbi:hypothetical protein [Acetobacterium sp.]|uniref:hypothetical protein n=1 Tax=Acetobacterium sp. TaxID=1872094 RepID=UPI00271618CB|nr:hypothetical protein [Acetobacterium sp.]MDO9492663.1 hypothetical protein [Acetobacterium sp.]